MSSGSAQCLPVPDTNAGSSRASRIDVPSSSSAYRGWLPGTHPPFHIAIGRGKIGSTAGELSISFSTGREPLGRSWADFKISRFSGLESESLPLRLVSTSERPCVESRLVLWTWEESSVVSSTVWQDSGKLSARGEDIIIGITVTEKRDQGKAEGKTCSLGSEMAKAFDAYTGEQALCLHYGGFSVPDELFNNQRNMGRVDDGIDDHVFFRVKNHVECRLWWY
ncbi:hypothetical protein ARMGADRAFT_1037187 [Armillaria gallica]|uniref:Uncharacterized protein n=1 Tax=Armillaria gallica TaxID=47427 RepID=A0A2H3D833_ARMGA|nr:hypothetical protein ARMGADRAFT_1037187 [Armillaria gallica]